jgi:hypothetical protein
MKRLLAILPLALAANAAAASPAATPILPGYWSWSAKALFGLYPAGDGRRCLKAEEISEFLAFPGNKHYKCTYPTKEIAGGKLTMQGACVDKKGRRAPIRARGTYNADSFRLNINLTTTNGLPVTGVMSAKRIAAECPAGSEGS